MIGYNQLGRNGRFGNQMFQYAALKGIARNCGYDFCVPSGPQTESGFHDEENQHKLFMAFDMPNVKQVDMFPAPYRKEVSSTFDEDLFNNCEDNVNLYGFFQTEKYFKHIEDDIRKDFTFHYDIFIACKELRETVDNPIALHIRRGDYVGKQDYHPVQPMSYYEQALKKFDIDRNVIIFSDDTKWCKEQELFESDRFIVAEDNDQFHDLCLMSMCDDFIIANSTFSWWGAWLGNRGKVVAPKQWFGKGLNHDTKDLYCDGWILL